MYTQASLFDSEILQDLSFYSCM